MRERLKTEEREDEKMGRVSCKRMEALLGWVNL